MVIHYKCPGCGADMIWDSEAGLLTCESCGRQMTAAEADERKQRKAETEDSFSQNPEYDSLQEYHCQNCGAVLLTDKTTAATTCSFCGAGVVLSDRLSGSASPSLIIPFSISREEATSAFQKWCKHGRLTPKGFMTADRIKSLTGIYVPFWLYDISDIAEADAAGTKVRHYSRGEYLYTETSHYHIYRKLHLNYDKLPVDASEKMNDTMMDRLEPYDYKALKDFSMPYLAGYLAEKNSYTADEVFERAKQRAEVYSDQALRESVTGYSTVNYQYRNNTSEYTKAHYALLPVWMVCYDYKQSEHTFAMNGQTGKIVGKPPLSIAKIAAWFFGISGGIFAFSRLITELIGGGFL